jgi:predicted ATPase/DNA-binding CsgD family transcriptional regulator
VLTGWSGLFLDPLIGRDHDLARLLDLLGRARLVTLTGTGGSGKTRLAQAAVADLRDTGHEAWFVDCSAVTDAGIVGATIVAAMDLQGAQGLDPLDLVIATLEERRALLALDNLEQIDRVGGIATRLLSATTQLSILATSRIPMRVRGETEFPVPPLLLPTEATSAGVLASPAGTLFFQRSGVLAAPGSLDEATAADIAALLRRLDGLPLAIELAAARTRVMSPREINRRLDARGTEGIDTGPDDRHRSLRSIMDWTVGQLSPGEVETLEAVSVCAGFDLALVQALVPDRDVLPAIESLLALGLIQRQDSIADTTRFMLLETIRTSVYRRLSLDRRQRFLRRHAEYFLALAKDWERQAEMRASPELVKWFVADADNVRRALDYLETAAPNAAHELFSRLGPFWSSHGRIAEGYERFRKSRAKTAEPSVELVRAAAGMLSAAWNILPAREFQELASWTATNARALGEVSALVKALRELAYLGYNENDLPALNAATAELEEIAAEAGEQGRISRAEIRTVAAAANEGRTSDLHVQLMRVYLSEVESADLVVRQASTQTNLAGSLLGRGEYEESAELARRAVDTYRRMDQPENVNWALALLAPALAGSGQSQEAVAAALECASIAIEVGHAENVASALWAAIPVALELDSPVLAAKLWGALVHGMVGRGDVVLNPLDTELVDGWIKRARRGSTDITIEVAARDGERTDPIQLLRSLTEALPRAEVRAVMPPILRHGVLTKREVEVLALVGRGRSDPEIAAELFISAKTASVHISNIKAKLGARSRLEIALRARDLGLVQA